MASIKVVVEGGPHHHCYTVVERGEFLQQGALEVVPDTCSGHREAAKTNDLFMQKLQGAPESLGEIRV